MFRLSRDGELAVGVSLDNRLRLYDAVGGMRASIYNAVPLAAVQALVDFMNDFARRKG